jgi:hypothetical protein
VIDLSLEDPISLPQTTRLLPPGREDRPVTLSCVLRWILKGAPGPDGKRIRLEALRVGGRWVTTIQALQRFAEALTPHLDGEPTPAQRTPTARRRAAERAGEQLDALGI